MTVSQTPKTHIWHGQASALLNAGRYRSAIDRYERVLEVNPADVNAWIEKGYALCELGQYDLALVSFQQAIRLAPHQARAWHGQGVAQAKKIRL